MPGHVGVRDVDHKWLNDMAPGLMPLIWMKARLASEKNVAADEATGARVTVSLNVRT